MADEGYSDTFAPGGGEGCGPYCDGTCGKCSSLLGNVWGLIGPYNDGGTCAPRWLDVSVEALWLQRDDAGRNIDLSSQGINGPIVLSTGQLAFEDRPSFRLTAWLQFTSGGNLEFNYYGLHNLSATSQVTDPTDGLYSVLSNFGTSPPGGFLEEGAARYQRAEYSSVFNNFEINYRRHWQGPGCRYSGSWLYGVRHFMLNEDFNFISGSNVNNASMNYAVNVNNAVTGAQIGSDLWLTLIPGLRLGMEGKVGVYGNHGQQDTTIVGTTLAVPYTEGLVSNDVAFLGDAAFMATYRLNQQFNLKFGYNFLYVDGLVLATENFNTTAPAVFVGGTNRPTRLNDNGDVFYHGASVGMEYNW
jgi:hypothetical protein